MKKLAIILALMSLLISCATTGSGTGISLHEAIEKSAEKIATELPAGSRVAIVAFASPNDNLSDYIMEEITGALIDFKIEVADRQNLEYVYQELNFHMSGDVSDETALSIGKFLGAQLVITGQLTDIGKIYRLRTSAIHVEGSTRVSVPRFDVRNDRAMQSMVSAIANQRISTRATKYGVNEQITPQTAGTFLDRGILFASRGDYEMAIMDFNEAIRLVPDLSIAYLLRGRAKFASLTWVTDIGENFSSVESFSPGFNISNDGTLSYSDNREQFDQVITDFTQALRYDPNNARIYYERGRTYYYRGDENKAIADYNQAIRLSSNEAWMYIIRGDWYAFRDDYNRAIADYTQAIRLTPNNAAIYYSRSNMFYYKGEYDQMISDYEKAIHLDPAYDAPDVVTIRSVDKHLVELSKSIKLNPNVYAFFIRGSINDENGLFDNAIADYSQAILLGEQLLGIVDYWDYYDQARVYHSRGFIYYLHKKNYDRAIEDFEIALRLDPNNNNIRRWLEEARQMRRR